MCRVLPAAGSTDRSRAPAHLEGAESPASEIQPRDQRRTEAVLCHEQREFTLNLQLKRLHHFSSTVVAQGFFLICVCISVF